MTLDPSLLELLANFNGGAYEPACEGCGATFTAPRADGPGGHAAECPRRLSPLVSVDGRELLRTLAAHLEAGEDAGNHGGEGLHGLIQGGVAVLRGLGKL